MQQSVDSAEIDKSAVFGEILHRPGDDRAFGQMFQSAMPPGFHFVFDRQLARNHDVSAAAIQFDDLNRNILADELIEIVNGTHVHLRARHKGCHADIHGQSTFGAFEDAPRDQ